MAIGMYPVLSGFGRVGPGGTERARENTPYKRDGLFQLAGRDCFCEVDAA